MSEKEKHSIKQVSGFEYDGLFFATEEEAIQRQKEREFKDWYAGNGLYDRAHGKHVEENVMTAWIFRNLSAIKDLIE